MRFGIQLYGLLRGLTDSAETILKQLAEIGIHYIEPCVRPDYDGEPEDPSIWTVSQFETYIQVIEKLGMECCSAHVFFDEEDQAVRKLIEWRQKYGIRQYVFNVQSEPTRSYCIQLAEQLSSLAEKTADAGIEILLHCLYPEVSVEIDGMTAYEWILANSHHVYMQPDVGFLLKAGIDVEAFLKRNQKKIRSLHYKDMTGRMLQEVPTGQGLLDTSACMQFARYMEIPQIIDQDSSQGDFYKDITSAYTHLSGLTFVRKNTRSRLCVLDTETGNSRMLKEYDAVIEAPNWLKDGKTLLYNRDGHLWKYHMETGEDAMLDTGICDNCNNDHVLSPDEKYIGLSHGWPSQVYVVPVEGGAARQITVQSPSYLHGWSPDGKELAYCAFRENANGGTDVDIYGIPAEGGEEYPLTQNAAFNDGAEYSADGKYIWFNSTRNGLMQAYRMQRDGSEPTQMTCTERNNWFPHVSPDCTKVLYISYSKEGLEPSEHLPNMQVELWLMNYDGSHPRLLKKLDGGQGSINVNSWAPDSRYAAYVEYVF